MIDSHAHLNDERFDGIHAQVIQRAKEAGVEVIINVGYDLPSSQKAIELAASYPGLYATVGFHPHSAKLFNEAGYDELITLAQQPKVVAIGEIGLDYYYDNSPREQQKYAFRRQMALAKELDLPVVIHSRDATKDTIDIIKEFPDVRCLLHCYSGSLETAREYLAMGHYISIAGPVTFKNASRLQEVAKNIPLDRLLIETDCPYLAPVPMRGKQNEPAYVKYVAEKLAELQHVSFEELVKQTMENTIKFFALEQ